MTKPTFSHHLRILREAGIVTKRIQGAKGCLKCAIGGIMRALDGRRGGGAAGMS
jgi:DNA-binding transcriptional ArsR family regulator